MVDERTQFERMRLLHRTRRMLAVLVAVGGLLTLSLGSALAHTAPSNAGRHVGWAGHDWSSKLALIASAEAEDENDVDEAEGDDVDEPDEDAQGEDESEDADEDDQGEDEGADEDDDEEDEADDGDDEHDGDEEHDGDSDDDEHDDDGEHDD